MNGIALRTTLRVVLHVLLSVGIARVASAQFAMNSFLCLKTDPRDHAELWHLVNADQALRKGGKDALPDSARRARVLALYRADSVQTAADFANASLILQHGSRPEDYLLAHEFAVVGVALGCGGMLAGFMLPATEARLLSALGLNADILQHSTMARGVKIITRSAAPPPPPPHTGVGPTDLCRHAAAERTPGCASGARVATDERQ
jgi:hypothetical protein